MDAKRHSCEHGEILDIFLRVITRTQRQGLTIPYVAPIQPLHAHARAEEESSNERALDETTHRLVHAREKLKVAWVGERRDVIIQTGTDSRAGRKSCHNCCRRYLVLTLDGLNVKITIVVNKGNLIPRGVVNYRGYQRNTPYAPKASAIQ